MKTDLRTRHLAILITAEAVLSASLAASPTPGEDWPRWRGPHGDGTWTETGLLKEFSGPSLEPVWRVEVSSGYSGPTVAGGLVYLTDRIDEPDEVERVLCFDAEDGSPIWEHEYDCRYEGVGYEAGPRANVLISDERAYALGTMGHLHCFDAPSGELEWSKDLRAEYDIQMPIWGISASPIVEKDLLIVPTSGKNASVVAFDRKTGEERWRALPDRGNYASPLVIDQAGRRVMVHWTGDRVLGLAPESGDVLWEYPFKSKRMPLGVASPVMHEGRLFLTGFYDGCLLLRVDPKKLAVEKLWARCGQNERSTDGLHSIISTPVLLGAHIYGVDSYGEFRCLSLATGDRVWEDQTAVPRARWATIHFVQNGDTTWMFNERGELLIGQLSPDGFEEKSRTKLLEPTRGQLERRGGVCWSHPAFANQHVFARNDVALVCASLRADPE